MKKEVKWIKSVSRHYEEVIARVEKPSNRVIVLYLSANKGLETVCSKRFKKRWWLREQMWSVYDRAQEWLIEQAKLIEEREKVNIVWNYEDTLEIDIKKGKKVRVKK